MTNNTNNNNDNQAVGDAALVQGPHDAQPSTSNGNTVHPTNASNYDASKARKSKKRVETEVWQEKLLRCLEPADVPQPQAAKKDYIDQGLTTVGLHMRENLSHNEI